MTFKLAAKRRVAALMACTVQLSGRVKKSTSSQFFSVGITLNTLGILPEVYLERYLPTNEKVSTTLGSRPGGMSPAAPPAPAPAPPAPAPAPPAALAASCCFSFSAIMSARVMRLPVDLGMNIASAFSSSSVSCTSPSS